MYEKVIVEFPEKNRSSVLRLLKDAQKIYEIKVYTENAKVLRFPGIEISLSERKVIVSGKKVPVRYLLRGRFIQQSGRSNR